MEYTVVFFCLRNALCSSIMHTMKAPKDILRENLSERMATNPSYSLRAFARDLDVSPQQLSNVINGRKGLSEMMTMKIGNRLGLNHHELNMFVESSRASFSRNKAVRVVAQAKLDQISSEPDSTAYLEMDLFKIISNWYHFALVELIKISPKSKNSISLFSKRLGISENEVSLALSRLERLNLISKENGIFIVNQETMIAGNGIPSEAVKNFHRQVMNKGLMALQTQNQEERYGSTSLMPIQVKNVKKAKKLIQELRNTMVTEVSDHQSGEEVYALSIQFFRLTEEIK